MSLIWACRSECIVQVWSDGFACSGDLMIFVLSWCNMLGVLCLMLVLNRLWRQISFGTYYYLCRAERKTKIIINIQMEPSLVAGLPSTVQEARGHVQRWPAEGDLWKHRGHLPLPDGLCPGPGETVQHRWSAPVRDRTLLPRACEWKTADYVKKCSLSLITLAHWHWT